MIRACYCFTLSPKKIQKKDKDGGKKEKLPNTYNWLVSLNSSPSFSQVTCVSCLLLHSFSVRELSCAVIISLALCRSLAESIASFLALRSMSTWRCRDSMRCCREEEEQRWVFTSILFLLCRLFSPLVPRSHGSRCLSSNRRKYTQPSQSWQVHRKPQNPNLEATAEI